MAAVEDPSEVIAIDRPGWNGRSTVTDLEGNVQAALDALDRRGVTRATIVGHSFGAAVACRLAIEHRHRVSALVLVAPAANRASLLRLDYWLAAPVGGLMASATALGVAGWLLRTGPLRRRIAERLELDEEHLDLTARTLRRPSAWTAFAAEQRSLVRELPTLEDRLGTIQAPTVVVIGTGDPVVPPRSARQLAVQIPQAQLVVIDGAGHLLPQQQAGRIAELIDEQRRR